MTIMTTTLRAAAFGMILAAAGGAASAADYTLSVNSALQTQDPLFEGLNAFKANVEKRTDGKVAVRLFPGSQLGQDEDVPEQARAGAGGAVVVDGGRLARYHQGAGGRRGAEPTGT